MDIFSHKRFIIQLNSPLILLLLLLWSLITHNLELAWRKHGRNCDIFYAWERYVLLFIQSCCSVGCAPFVRLCCLSYSFFFVCTLYLFSLSVIRSIFTFVPLYSILSIGKCKIQNQHTFPQVIWVFFFYSVSYPHSFFLYECSSLTTLKSGQKKKRKHQKSFIIVIWGAVMYQYRM